MNRRLFLTSVSAAPITACAPITQHALARSEGFAGPRLEPDALISFDGARLPMTVWTANDASGVEVEPLAVVIGLHGFDDYAQSFVLAGPYWAAQGITTYAYDQRGHGRGDPQARGVWGGETLMTEDLRTICALVRTRHPRTIIAVVGESMGGAVAITTFASKSRPDADRLILASPAVWGWDDQPIPSRVALWLAAHLAPSEVLKPPSWITRKVRASDNLELLRAMGRDRNMIWGSRVDALYGLVNLMRRAQEEIGRVRAPTLYLYGAHDQIIPREAALRAVAKLPASARTAFYANGWHLLNRDLHARTVLDDVAAFIRDPTAPLPSGAPPILSAAAHGTRAVVSGLP